MTASELDDVDLLLAQLKTLPLIDNADLDADFAAYDAFELLLGAVLRAALVQVPPAERYDNNGELFKRFVVERFPAGRGFGNADYASKLWKFRNAVVKNKQTGPFLLIHNAPSKHWKIERGARVLDLQSLVAGLPQGCGQPRTAPAFESRNEGARDRRAGRTHGQARHNQRLNECAPAVRARPQASFRNSLASLVSVVCCGAETRVGGG
jgi:hypothetical protein